MVGARSGSQNQNIGGGHLHMREVLESFHSFCASAYLNLKLPTQDYQIDMHCYFLSMLHFCNLILKHRLKGG